MKLDRRISLFERLFSTNVPLQRSVEILDKYINSDHQYDYAGLREISELNTHFIDKYVATLTLQASLAIRRIQPREFLLKPRDQVNINEASRISTCQSQYVRQSILAIEYKSQRNLMIERWIFIAMRSHQQGNFFSAQAIYVGLMLLDISRLFEVDGVFRGLSETALEALNWLKSYYDVTNDAVQRRKAIIIKYAGSKLPTLDLLTKKVQGDIAGTRDNLSMRSEKLTEELEALRVQEMSEDAEQAAEPLAEALSGGAVVASSAESMIAKERSRLSKELLVVNMQLEEVSKKSDSFVVNTLAQLYKPFDSFDEQLICSELLKSIDEAMVPDKAGEALLRSKSVSYQAKDASIEECRMTKLLGDIMLPLLPEEIKNAEDIEQILLLQKIKSIFSPENLFFWQDRAEKSIVKSIVKMYKAANSNLKLEEKLSAIIKILQPHIEKIKKEWERTKVEVSVEWNGTHRMFARVDKAKKNKYDAIVTDLFSSMDLAIQSNEVVNIREFIANCERLLVMMRSEKRQELQLQASSSSALSPSSSSSSHF